MTSAAYGFGRDSVAEATAECCQAQFFLKQGLNRGAAEEKYEAWHAPFEGFGRSRVCPSALAARTLTPPRSRSTVAVDGRESLSTDLEYFVRLHAVIQS